MNILLVDDDTGVIQALLPVLKTLPNANVRVATTGEKALENAEALGNLDILVSDVVMQPMDGFTLRDHLKAIYPAMRTVFVTGYDLSDYPEQTADHIVLEKPVDIDALRAAVSEAATPAPTPTPTPKATAAPTVSPTPVTMTVPRAQPRVPTATPGAAIPSAASFPKPPSTPRAMPSSSVGANPAPRATPSPTPAPPVATPRATPQVSATPRATPTATPQVSATPRATPTATPRVSATPVATPTATPRVSATPMATPTATPRVSTTPVAPVPAATPKASVPVHPSTSDSLIGTTLGAFQIIRKLGDGTWGGIYEAVQTSMGRPVAINILAPHLQQDPAEKGKFISGASAKANVQHPLILSVYEAGEIEGHCYFTHEYVDGLNIEDMVEKGITIDEPQALQVVKVVTEAMSYLNQNKMPHTPLQMRHIYLGSDGRPRVANLATWQQDLQPPVQHEIAMLAQSVCAVLPDGQAADPGLQAMLQKMQAPGPMGYLSWVALLQTVKSLEPKVVPADAFKLSQQDVTAIRAVEDTRRRQKRTLLLNIAGIALLFTTIGTLVYWKFIRDTRVDAVMVKIPAGEFIYQTGETRTLPDFWIDKYEVTIGQYAEFLEYLDRNPTDQFDHPNQPPGHRHEPTDWIIYYERAKAEKPVRGFQTINLNTPVTMVDWWDAYAYSKWLGRRLPTEEEWERAARGSKGNQYPWGNEFDPGKVNSAKDHQPRVATGEGSVDGWNYWSPVDAVAGDKSPDGVIGMGGNVREWTSSWDDTGKFPIVRGGSYESESNKTTYRVNDLPDTTRVEHIGFRTAASNEPKD